MDVSGFRNDHVWNKTSLNPRSTTTQREAETAFGILIGKILGWSKKPKQLVVIKKKLNMIRNMVCLVDGCDCFLHQLSSFQFFG